MTGHSFLQTPEISFLMYRSRSGSTFLGDRLSRHPEVLVTPESNVVPRLIGYLRQRDIQGENINYEDLVDYLLEENKLRDWQFPKESLLKALREQNDPDWAVIFHTICRVYRDYMKPEAKVVVFKKSGWYYQNIDLLLTSYPGSIVIGMVRDPRAVYNSARKAMHSERQKPMAESLLENVNGWRKYISLMQEAVDKWPDRMLLLRYESFLYDVPGILSEIWKKLGVKELKQDELKAVLAAHEESHLVKPATMHLHNNVSQPPMTERTEKWREELSTWQAGLIWLICRKEMKKFGYY